MGVVADCVEEDQGVAVLHVKKRHRRALRFDGLEAALCVGHRLAAFLHRGVEALVVEVELIEAGVERARDVALDKDIREVVDVAKAHELEDLLLGLEPEAAGDLLARQLGAEEDDVCLGEAAFQAHGVLKAADAHGKGLLYLRLGDDGAPTAALLDITVRGKDLERLTDGCAAHAIGLGELELGGNRLADRVRPVLYLVEDVFFDVVIQVHGACRSG